MVTGASGEGKSSLIYAGLIPNARSGFFKAKYTNWVVADFRPERSPVKKMASAIAEKFALQPATIETELRRGYSSLIDIYTNSEFFIDEREPQWLQLSDQQRSEKKRKAANLLILVDQFEEFFTNPENFFDETPSEDSQIVVNLILETARISIKNELPVYVVCTMRSDYIGQCSAFRGLPEYIGFSQFFVPRLKRKDLKQVVEEPAILSGNRISQRLIERLVYDLSEGVDQLPILQHALSQIWLTASHGAEEMDLIHYAKVGGMPPEELPDEDREKYSRWFNELPVHQKKYYDQTGLSKVIEIHASTLYENAWITYNQKHIENKLTQQDAKRIIALAFCCLTKIDNSRAVRNRMTLREITEIINVPAFSSEVVGDVLGIYRDESNSFIRPFKTGDTTTHSLPAESVLDITHESLIRNWSKLNDWASQEFDFYTTYLDFKKQLNRWKNSGKSRSYLLPIGPLSYFENWYDKCRPNIGWIKRYSEIQEDEGKSTANASVVLTDIKEFLKRSARNVMVTRAFMKYGAQRIAVLLAVLVMFILSGFYWADAEQKTNKSVIQKVRSKAATLLSSKEIDIEDKAFHMLVEERYESGQLISSLEKIDAEIRLGIAIKTYRQLLIIDKHSTLSVKTDLIRYIQSAIQKEATNTDYEQHLVHLNELVILLSYDNYYNPGKDTRDALAQLTDLSLALVRDIFRNNKKVRPTFTTEMNIAIQWWLTFGNVGKEQVEELVHLISPYNNLTGKETFDIYYEKGRGEPNGRTPNINNGGYHTVASLYAALGDTDGVLWCFNQIIAGGQKEYFGVGRQFNNYTNIVGFYYQFNHRQEIGPLLEWLAKNDPADRPVTVYRNILIRAGYLSRYFPNNIEKFYLRTYRGYFFPNLCLINEGTFMMLSEDYVKEVQKLTNVDEQNYQLALHYKRLAIHRYKYQNDRSLTPDHNQLNEWLERSTQHLRKTNKDYLNEEIEITISYVSDGVRTKRLSRKQVLIYPDYMDGWFSYTFHSDIYFKFLEKNNLLPEYYETSADLELLLFWIAKGHELKPPSFSNPLFDNTYALSDSTFIKIIEFTRHHVAGGDVDLNYCYAILANRYFTRGDTVNGLRFANQLNQDGITRTSNKYEYIEKTFFLNQVKYLCAHLASTGNKDFALELAGQFVALHEKLFCYVQMAEATYQSQNPQFFIYLDSAMSTANQIDFETLNFQWDARYNLISFLMKVGGEKMNQLAFDIFRDIPEGIKFYATLRMAEGLAFEGNLFKAQSSIPPTFTENQELIACNVIVWKVCQKREQEQNSKVWERMDFSISGGWNYPIYFAPF